MSQPLVARLEDTAAAFPQRIALQQAQRRLDYAGLRDAYRFTGNREALEVEIRYAEWAEKILSGLTDEQVQKMLNTEFGGMNEVFADLFADTGDARWLALSRQVEHHVQVDQDQARGVLGALDVARHPVNALGNA